MIYDIICFFLIGFIMIYKPNSSTLGYLLKSMAMILIVCLSIKRDSALGLDKLYQWQREKKYGVKFKRLEKNKND